MKKPFRWNIENSNELGSLLNSEFQKEIDTKFLSELIRSTSRIIAFSDNSKLYFVGRSPENYFDFLNGIYSNSKSRKDQINLFQFSGRFLDEAKTTSGNIQNLKEYMHTIGLSPQEINKSDKNTALIDLVYTGSTMRNLITIIKDWAKQDKHDWNSVKRKLRIVGITDKTKNSPNTWRWQQQPNSIEVLDGTKVKNVSVDWGFWAEIGNNQNKVTPSNSPEKWENSAESIEPNRSKRHIEGLNFANQLNHLGKNDEIRIRLKKEMQNQIEMKTKWFKEWYNEI